jgi:hypothetical protein
MRYVASALLLPLLASGCFLELMGATAIQGTLQAEQATALNRQLNNVKNAASDIELNHAIQAYHAEYGYYPASLDALVPDYFSSVPTKPDGTSYGYEPDTGMLYEAPLTNTGESDAQKIREINTAINAYGNATGYYPGDLYQLVPDYLWELPSSDGGRQFHYDPNTGAVTDPDPSPAPQQAGRPAQRGFGGGGSPAVEAMTGLGIAQELNQMSSGGSSAAGSRARGGLNGSVQQHNQLQQQMLDQLP